MNEIKITLLKEKIKFEFPKKNLLIFPIINKRFLAEKQYIYIYIYILIELNSFIVYCEIVKLIYINFWKNVSLVENQ